MALLLSQHQPAHQPEVIDLSTCFECPAIGRALSLGEPHSTVLATFQPHLLLISLNVASLCISSSRVKVSGLFLCYLVFLFAPSGFFYLLGPLQYPSTSSIIMFSSTDTSLSISLIIPSSFSSCVNCSVTLLSYPL